MATSNVDGSHVQAAEHHHQLVVGGCVSKGERAPLTCNVSASVIARGFHGTASLPAKRTLSLVDLPIDLMESILYMLFCTWSLGTRTLRVSMALKVLATTVRSRLPPGEWWTGCKPPLAVPHNLPAPDVRVVRAQQLANMGVVAGERDDIKITLLRADVWLTNFTISIVLCAALPELMVGTNLPPALLVHVDTPVRVLNPTIFDLLAFNDPVTIATSSNTMWGRPAMTALLCTTLHILSVLCLDNNHWVALRTSKEFNLVELFLFLQTEHERVRARVYAEEVVSYLIAVGHLQLGVRYQYRTSPEWRQRDGSSCGLFALGTIVSLARDHRLKLDCSDSAGRQKDWRRYFARLVVDAAQATAVGSSDDEAPRTPVELKVIDYDFTEEDDDGIAIDLTKDD